MKTHLLVVPSKKTEEVNWTKPLNNYLLSIYGNTSAYQTDLNLFDKLRQDIRGVNADNTGLKLYYRYYSQLEILDLKVQFALLNKSKKSEFVWHDAFDPEITHQQNALPFEKANVLFNIGSLLTRFAQSQYIESQSSKEASSVKESILMLQQAAGVYAFINENFLHAPSDDLSQSTIKFLSKLSLAQAQEIFTLNVIRNDLDQSKNSLISKLCKSTSILYEECFAMIGKEKKEQYKIVGDYDYDYDDYDDDDDDDNNIKNIGAGLDGSEGPEDIPKYVTAQLESVWIAVIRFKAQYYKSLAYYFHGLLLESTRKYGDSIAYLTQSKEILDEIKPHHLKAYDLVDNLKYQKDNVSIKLADLNKDNDLIYHDPIRKNVNIDQLSPMQVAKVVPINQIPLLKEANGSDFGNFLSNVVPTNIHELSSFYSEEKSQLLRNEIDYYEVSNEEAASLLEVLNLPKGLYQIKEALSNENEGYGGGRYEGDDGDDNDVDEIPETVLNQVSEISRSYNEDQRLEAENNSLRKQVFDIVSKLNSYDNQDEAINLKKALYEASKADEKLSSLVDKNLYQRLQFGPRSQQFRSLFKVNSGEPEVSLMDMDDSQDKQVKIVEQFLKDLNLIKQNKKEVIERLRKEVHSDDISDILVFNSRSKSDSEIKSVIFPAELKKFKPFTDKLDNLINKEKLVQSDLKKEWDTLVMDPQIKRLQKSSKAKVLLRQEVIKKINSFYQGWTQYHSGLKKGNTWYKNLLHHCQDLENESQADFMSKSTAQLSLREDRSGSNAKQYSDPFFSNSQQQQQQQQPPPLLPQQQQQQQQPSLHHNHYNNNNNNNNNSCNSAPYSGYNHFGEQPQLTGSSQPLNPSSARPALSSIGTSGSSSSYIQSQYSRPPQLPPQLPPKRSSNAPNFDLPRPPLSQYGSETSLHQTKQYPHQSEQLQSLQNQSHNQSQKREAKSGLIYDQPSTYDPSMYDFFSK
ncbi:bck1-like resistance to osmotic shock [Lodderomyces elongisporus]|uniref:bck1-like resistance to osmotic shock n=1 Tax=Lodderomyces elongisporus TaxID=36914 RepID=UPI00291F541B|nr:bck1-like resistance to osmotic shock [Lodderomyces elongisporus]WLF78516.1 bck1-like resistance to osmotic shock [Lodderomyces elongisporus]